LREFTTSVTIAASPHRVWTVLADVERWPDWTRSVSRIEHLGPGALGVGSRVRIEQPRLRPAVWTVTAWQPALGFAWVAPSPGAVATGLHAIEACAGGSKVTLTIRFTGLLAPVVGLLAGRLTREYMGLEAAGLKARCEEDARP